MKNILVIGGCGFIGSHLVEQLKARDYRVAVLVRNSSDTRFIKSLGVELRSGDLEDVASLKQALVGIDTIFSAVNVKPTNLTPEQYQKEILKLHTQGTENLIKASLDSNARRLIYFSSVAAIGYQKGINIYNESSEPSPVDAYGRAKLAAEEILNQASKDGNINITIMRPPGVFGERGLGSLAKIIFFINKKVIPVIGSGENKQSFAYVGNLINQAIFLAENQAAIGKTYITSDQEPYSVNELINAVSEAMKTKAIKIHIPAWLIMTLAKILKQESIIAIASERVFDSSRIFKELGYKQEYDLTSAVKRTLEWCNKNA